MVASSAGPSRPGPTHNEPPMNDKRPISDPSQLLRRLVVEKSVQHMPYIHDIAERSGLPVEVVDERDYPDLVDGSYPDNLRDGKQVLLLCRNRGGFLKHCPSTRDYRCCGYRIINTGTGCPMDCVYCILQAYLNSSYLSFFVNTDDLLVELSQRLSGSGGRPMRIGTGEFTDSMALDRITALSTKLVPFFAGQPHAVLELKSKAACIDHLEDLDHNGRTIMAWSLNSATAAASLELHTASLGQRLEAAARCASWGYPLAFHFDPIIHHQGWRDGYRQIIDQLFATVPAEAIRWISLGALRFMPKLAHIGGERFPEANIFHHEFVPGLDNKSRYFRSLRSELYRFVWSELKQRCDPRTCIYFCMESDELWREVTGFTPAERGGLAALLDRAVFIR